MMYRTYNTDRCKVVRLSVYYVVKYTSWAEQGATYKMYIGMAQLSVDNYILGASSCYGMCFYTQSMAQLPTRKKRLRRSLCRYFVKVRVRVRVVQLLCNVSQQPETFSQKVKIQQYEQHHTTVNNFK